MQPVSIKVKDKMYLQILWDDNTFSELKLSNIRRSCPCAKCLAEKEQESNSYFPIYSLEQLKVNSIKMVGTYAIGIFWGDNHDTGIFDFRYLKQLSEQGLQN